jgi:uncharacterized protein (TIGR02646 family)
MIKLERNFTPICLNSNFVKKATEEFKNTQKNVWNFDELKIALLELSFGKCAYCECDLKEESKYMEVEHFQDKDEYPDLVLLWNNLLPSCKRCNGKKSTHNVIADPIVNPFVENPQNHFILKHYRFKEKTIIGKTTIDVVDLNNTERAVRKRFEVGEQLQKSIENVNERLQLFKENPITQRKNKLLGMLEELLRECQPETSYSATCSTILHTDANYLNIRIELQKLKLWSDEFENLHNNSLKLILN